MSTSLETRPQNSARARQPKLGGGWPGEIVALLLDRKLIEARHLLEHPFRIIDRSRRNQNLELICATGPSYFVKLGVGTERRRTVAHEADLYRLLGAMTASFAPRVGSNATLQRFLPRCHGFDAERVALIVELEPGAQSVAERLVSVGRFSKSLAREVGMALASLHDATSFAEGDRQGAWFRRLPPFPPLPFRLSRPDVSMLQQCSAANLELIRLVQGDLGLAQGLVRAEAEWVPETLIHADARFDNWILLRAGKSRAARVKLVDWELAGLGDPAWDVGCVFEDFLKSWLLSAPLSESPEASLARARRPLSSLLPALGRFWQAYREHREQWGRKRERSFDAPDAERLLHRATRLAGVRLIQRAFELLQSENRLSGSAVYLLQLSANLMARPEDASARLLGIAGPTWT